MIEETVFSEEDLANMLKAYDAVEEGVNRYQICQSSAFRGLIIARAAPYVEAVNRAKKALETPEESGVTVKAADLKRLIGVHDDLYAAEMAYEYSLDGYRLFRNQAVNIHGARNNVMAVNRLKAAMSLYSAGKGASGGDSDGTDNPAPKGRKTKGAQKD